MSPEKYAWSAERSRCRPDEREDHRRYQPGHDAANDAGGVEPASEYRYQDNREIGQGCDSDRKDDEYAHVDPLRQQPEKDSEYPDHKGCNPRDANLFVFGDLS
jgi:hypothetical protein